MSAHGASWNSERDRYWRFRLVTECEVSHPSGVGLRLFRGWHHQKSWEDFAMKSLAFATLLAFALTPSYGFAQSTGHNMSDEELIKLALSAAPEAVAKDATVVAMDHDGKMRTLRQGTGQWTCMPGHADPANPDPMCGDQNAMEWGMAWMNHQEPPANKVGFMYMLRGDGGASNTDPYATKEEPGNNWIKTGAHVMIVGSGAKMLDGYPRDAKADPTKPYVMWPGTQYEHLMLPVR
jgi:hypothetical protein